MYLRKLFFHEFSIAFQSSSLRFLCHKWCVESSGVELEGLRGAQPPYLCLYAAMKGHYGVLS